MAAERDCAQRPGAPSEGRPTPTPAPEAAGGAKPSAVCVRAGTARVTAFVSGDERLRPGLRADWTAAPHVTRAARRPAPARCWRLSAAAGPRAHFHFPRRGGSPESARVPLLAVGVEVPRTHGRHSEDRRVGRACGRGLTGPAPRAGGGRWHAGASRFAGVKGPCWSPGPSASCRGGLDPREKWAAVGASPTGFIRLERVQGHRCQLALQPRKQRLFKKQTDCFRLTSKARVT